MRQLLKDRRMGMERQVLRKESRMRLQRLTWRLRRSLRVRRTAAVRMNRRPEPGPEARACPSDPSVSWTRSMP